MSKRHGGHGTLTYSRWKSMMQRCNDPKSVRYARYGGAGIKVCARWRDFSLFLLDMGECQSRSMTLDRIDNSRGYEPGNCRWATKAEQSRNRPSHCIALTHNGVTQNVADWARQTGIGEATIRARLRLGWPAERAVTAPPDGNPKANRHPRLQQLTFRGETRPLIAWAESMGITPNTLRMRLKLGWTVERALTT